MKRKEDDKVSGGPMFPRLHVNDTDKGGPRAPPRNKMALYEQLSVPSQRLNRGVLPLSSNSGSNSNMVPPATAGQGRERNMFFPRHPPSSTNTRMDEESRARQSNDSNLNSPCAQLEQGDKVGEGDDFQVPIFVHSGRGQVQRKTQNGGDRETQTPLRPNYSVCSTKLQNGYRKDSKQFSSQDQNLRQELRRQSRENPNECMSNMDHSMKSTRRKMNEPSKEANSALDIGHQDHLAANLSRLQEIDASLQHGYSSRPDSEDIEHGGIEELTRYVQKGSTPSPSNDEPDDQTRGSRSQPGANAEKSDDASENSMVDSISSMDISPDDVVGIIGQKRFWKARRAIVNQQRVFAVQVFELHRLIKVQKLIAATPRLLHEDGAPIKESPPIKKVPEYVVRTPSFVVKRKDLADKANDKMECSAENAVGKTSAVSIKNGTQASGYAPYAPSTPVCFPQAHSQQWLVPVMTPSEGLVYKPYYPGPGFVPFSGNVTNPGYAVPTSHHQGMLLPGGPQMSHSYFPPYAMPVMNQFAGPVPVPVPHGQILGLQHQSSCNVPTQKSGSTPQARKGSELQGSAVGGQTGGLWSMAPEAVPQARGNSEQTPRVIRVVPHNPRSATESAARIFQSIQKERSQYDCI